jgi:hypothetical protein
MEQSESAGILNFSVPASLTFNGLVKTAYDGSLSPIISLNARTLITTSFASAPVSLHETLTLISVSSLNVVANSPLYVLLSICKPLLPPNLTRLMNLLYLSESVTDV